jgi:hypothetical protein
MAIGTIQGASGFYDPNRDMYYKTPARSSQEQYERETYFHRMQEEEYRRMQSQYVTVSNSSLTAPYNPDEARRKEAPGRDPQGDRLSFLRNTKLLLTGAST